MARINYDTSSLRDIHKAMLQRCYNRDHKSYKYYGKKGIKVCARWRGDKGRLHLFEDMGARPEGMTLDRIDNTKGYSPTNCRWATRKQQVRNRKGNNYVSIEGKTMCLTEAAEYIGISIGTVKTRIRRGMSTLEALLTPLR